MHWEDPEEMVRMLTALLEKKTTCMREPLEVGIKLAVALRFSATSDLYASLHLIGYITAFELTLARSLDL